LDQLESYFHSKERKWIAISFVDPSMALHLIKGDFSVLKLDSFKKDGISVESLGLYEEYPNWITEKHNFELLTLAEYFKYHSICESKILVKGLEIMTDLSYLYVSYSSWDDIKDSISLILKSHCYYYADLIVENLHHDETIFDIYSLRFINNEQQFKEKLEKVKKTVNVVAN